MCMALCLAAPSRLDHLDSLLGASQDSAYQPTDETWYRSAVLMMKQNAVEIPAFSKQLLSEPLCTINEEPRHGAVYLADPKRHGFTFRKREPQA